MTDLDRIDQIIHTLGLFPDAARDALESACRIRDSLEMQHLADLEGAYRQAESDFNDAINTRVAAARKANETRNADDYEWTKAFMKYELCVEARRDAAFESLVAFQERAIGS